MTTEPWGSKLRETSQDSISATECHPDGDRKNGTLYTLCAHVCPLLQGLQHFWRCSGATQDPEAQNSCPEAPLEQRCAHAYCKHMHNDTP